MKFQTWIRTAKDLMDMIKLIPKDYPEMIKEYNSTPFSIRYDPFIRSTTFKRSVPAPEDIIPPAQIQGNSISGNTTNTNITTITGTLTITSPLIPNAPIHASNGKNKRLNVSITVRDSKLIDLKFISKDPDSFRFSTEGTEDGGVIEHTMLYIGEDKMIYNGVLYDLNTPAAFSHDISTETDVSIMELFYLKEYYETGTKTI